MLGLEDRARIFKLTFPWFLKDGKAKTEAIKISFITNIRCMTSASSKLHKISTSQRVLSIYLIRFR